MDKEDVVYIHIYYSDIKRNEITAFATTWLDYHTKWIKSDRERQISYDITNMWNLRKWSKWIYLWNRKKLRHKRKTYDYQRGKVRQRVKLGVWH